MKNKSNLYYITFLIFMAYAAHIPCDGYLPCLLDIQQNFLASSNIIQLSTSLYLLGISLSQLIGGGISDIYGRKFILLIGFVVYSIGCCICILSTSIYLFLAGRLIQGLGMGASGAIRFSILRDLFSATQFSRAVSIINISTTTVISISPIIIGFVNQNYGWKYIFILMLLTSAFLILYVSFFHETLKTNHRQTSLIGFLQSYGSLINNIPFLASVFNNGLIKSSYFICLLSNAFIFQTIFKWSSIQFGGLLAFQFVTLTFGSMINAMFVTKYGIKWLTISGMIIMVFGCFLLLLFGLCNSYNPVLILGAQFCVILGGRIQYANILTAALEPFPTISGAASAIFNSFEMFTTALLCSLLAFNNLPSLLNLSITLCIICAISWVLGFKFLLFRKNNSLVFKQTHLLNAGKY